MSNQFGQLSCEAGYVYHDGDTIPAPTDNGDGADQDLMLSEMFSELDNSRYRISELENVIVTMRDENKALQTQNMFLADRCQCLEDKLRRAK